METNNVAKHISETQLGLFGGDKTYVVNRYALKFCIKKHDAITAKLHYDLRLQFTNLWLKSFAVKPGLSMDPKIIVDAVLVEEHKMSAFRREGTILDDTGEGSVLHPDEGYFTIPGVSNVRELKRELEIGLKRGSFVILIDGYKVKGLFKFYRNVNKKDSDWKIQKISDEFASESDVSLLGRSLLTDRTIDYYNDLYNKQKADLEVLNPIEQIQYIKENEGASFAYNRIQLPPRPDKILPYD